MKRTNEGARRRGCMKIPGALLLLAFAPAAIAGPYTFVNIADTTTGPYTDFPGVEVALNNAGTVVFSSFLGPGRTLPGIFVTGTGGAVTTVADSSGPFDSFARPTINDGGTVAFHATLDGGAGSGIFSVGSGGLVTIAKTGAAFSDLGAHVAINSGGTVGFVGALTAGGSGAFAGNGAPPLTLADTSGPLSGFGVALSPGIGLNNAGTAVFLAGLDTGGTGVFTSDGATLTQVATAAGTGNTGLGLRPAINAGGTVAFIGINDGGTPGSSPAETVDDRATLYKWAAGTLTTVADTSGKFKSFGGVGINAAGTILFIGLLDDGGFGYYTSDDLSNPVISFGDTLFGFTVTGLDSYPAFNDAGQVAFSYELRLDDRGTGQRGIALATAFAAGVPVPATPALLGLGLGMLAFGRRRATKR